MAFAKSSSGNFGLMTEWPWFFQHRRLHAARNRLPSAEEENGHGVPAFTPSCRANAISITSGSFSAPTCRNMLTTCAVVYWACVQT